MYKQQMDTFEAIEFLSRCAPHQKTLGIRTTSLLNLGNRLVRRGYNHNIVASSLKSLSIRFEDDNFRIEMERFGYSIYNRSGKLKTINSLINEIKTVGVHPSLARMLGYRNWDVLKWLF